MNRIRGPLALSLFAIIALSTIACSSRDSDAVLQGIIPADVVRAAPEKVEEANTLTFEMTMAFEGLDLDAIEEANDDEEDPFGLGALFIGLFAEGFTIEGALDFEQELSYTKFDLGMFSGEEIVAEGKCYSKSSFFGGSKWTVAENCEGSGFGDIFGGIDEGPTGLLAELEAEADSVEDLGAGEMHGVPARHYRAYFTDPELEGQVEEYPVPVNVWFDSEGRPLRLEVRMTYKAGAEEMADFEGFTDGPVSAVATMDFMNYGEPVDIEIPSEDEIEEEPDFGFDFGTDDEEGFEGSAEDWMDESYVDGVCLNRKWFATDVEYLLDEGLSDEETAERYAEMLETLAEDMDIFANPPDHAREANDAYIALLEDLAADVRANGMDAVEDPTRIPFELPAEVRERLEPFAETSVFCEGTWFDE